MGLLMIGWHVGTILVLPFVSFFGSRWHIPRVLGAMEVLKGISIAVAILPHFLFGQGIVTIFKATAAPNILAVVEETHMLSNFTVTTPICHPPRENSSGELENDLEGLMEESRIALGLLILSYFLVGIALVAGTTLGMVYIDNNFKKSQLPSLFGLLGALSPLGPFVGGMLSVVFNRIYVDLSGYPIALFRLLTTPIFMLIVFNSILSDFAWSGWPTFSMKYYYQIFRVPDWKIATIEDVTDMLISPLGGLCGGIIISRLRPSYATVTLLTLFSFLSYAAVGVGRMFITRGDSNYAGFDYDGYSPAQLMGDCTAGCECGLEAYSPVCDNGLTYFTPCHAGCELGNTTHINGVMQRDLQNFYQCNCTDTGFAVPGRCEGDCDLVYLYVGLKALSAFVWKMTRTVDILVIIRAVGYFEKAFALGVNLFLGALLGALPSAPVIGMVIDSTCRVFQRICGVDASCWIYDTDQRRFRMYGYTLGIMMVQIVVYLAIFYLAKKKNLQLFDEDDPISLETREHEHEMGEVDDGNKELAEHPNTNKNTNDRVESDAQVMPYKCIIC